MRGPVPLLLALVALNAGLMAVGAVAVRQGPARKAGVRVGLVFDVGGRGDRSFNDSAWKGLERARDELGVDIETIEPGDGSDREGALRQMAAGGADLVIGVGFLFSRDLDKVAAAFPKVAFAGVDYAPDGDQPMPPNLVALKFREEEGSFIVGAIAAMTSHSGVVGFVGGMKIPLIRKFEAGYIAGVHHVCPDCRVLSAYAGTDAAAFSDPTTGRELADAQLGEGADVIFHASGKTGLGVIGAAAERRKWVIGVDADQYDDAPCCVLTSMVKGVDVAVLRVAKDVVDGTFHGGIRELGLAEGGVGFVSDERNLDRLPPETVGRARDLEAQIVAGEIEVPSQ